jgi:hypothetical protein
MDGRRTEPPSRRVLPSLSQCRSLAILGRPICNVPIQLLDLPLCTLCFSYARGHRNKKDVTGPASPKQMASDQVSTHLRQQMPLGRLSGYPSSFGSFLNRSRAGRMKGFPLLRGGSNQPRILCRVQPSTRVDNRRRRTPTAHYLLSPHSTARWSPGCQGRATPRWCAGQCQPPTSVLPCRTVTERVWRDAFADASPARSSQHHSMSSTLMICPAPTGAP